ncbi:MAG: UvrD-helicase domain-containing protein, partial [Hyphomicrobiales bacterium]
MPDFVPADQPERDRIASELGATLFVEAGAGTGKTTALVERIARLVASGIELHHIAAITFTEAAAAELRDRIRLRLEDALREAAPGGVEAARFEAALHQLDAAAVQTLHGFAQRILALYPLEAGLPPRIEIIEPVRARIAFEEQWQLLLDELLADDSHGLPIVRAMQLGLEISDLHDLAREFHEHYHQLRDQPFPTADPPDLNELIAALEEAADYADCCIDASDLLLPFVERAGEVAERLREAEGDDEAIIRVLRDPRRLSSKYGRTANWGGAGAQEVRDALKDAEALRQECREEYARAALLPLLERLRTFVLDWAEERRRRGTLEFHDLLVLARDLLRSNAEARAALSARFQRLLIDEFQDTDPIQLEIAALLATPLADIGERRWDELPVEPGRLFFVGDPKQAIYHFRGADIALYARARAVFGGETLDLRQNFRSVPAIIRFVNALFGRLIEDGNGDRQPPYVRLEASRQSIQAALPVHLIGEPHEAGTVDPVRRVEAEDIVRAVRAIKAEGWMIEDPVTHEQRPARYEDITVLLPTRTVLPWLERAFEDANLPYRVESRSLLYETQEVREITNILAAIDDPTDEVSLVAALRSPAFACGDDDLYAWKQAHGQWDYRREPPPGIAPDHPVALAMSALRALHKQRWWLGLNELVERVIRERKMFELGYAFRRPRERWQRLRFVLEQARGFAAEGGTMLREFVAWLRMQAEEDVAVVDTVVAQEDDDALRITTMHASKGLEFPIVILAGLNTAPRTRKEPVLWRSEGLPEVRTGRDRASLETDGYVDLHQEEKETAGFEMVRLLYVAATRARDHLLVSVHHPAAKDSQAKMLDETCQQFPELWRPFAEMGGERADPAPARVLPADDGSSEEEWTARRAALLAAAGQPPAHAATSIAHAPEDEEPGEAAKPWRRGRAATSIGRAVHAALQSADLATGE